MVRYWRTYDLLWRGGPAPREHEPHVQGIQRVLEHLFTVFRGCVAIPVDHRDLHYCSIGDPLGHLLILLHSRRSGPFQLGISELVLWMTTR